MPSLIEEDVLQNLLDESNAQLLDEGTMAKTSGLGDNFYIGGYDLSGDVSSIDKISGGPALLDVTAIKQFAMNRIGGLRDGSMSFTSLFNFGGSGNPVNEHDALSTLPVADRIASYFRGSAIGNQAACLVAKQLNYDPTRDNSGNLNEKVDLDANSFGLEWCEQLTAGLRTDTTATAGTALDDAASSSHGAQGYLQVIAFTGTSVDIKIEHSADNSTWATLIDFGAQSARGALRGTSTGTVNRYLRATTGTGTFTSVTFAICINRNPVTVVF
jgi:hypothetical protein